MLNKDWNLGVPQHSTQDAALLLSHYPEVLS